MIRSFEDLAILSSLSQHHGVKALRALPDTCGSLADTYMRGIWTNLRPATLVVENLQSQAREFVQQAGSAVPSRFKVG
jgi:hypothetical protein